ncbi:hypothetical protein CSC71_04790 [Pseudoxanthomonas sangjuensis]|nr:hypothetical protein CSC71_04790 [Pseudoxanthomonas sangjuensis]
MAGPCHDRKRPAQAGPRLHRHGGPPPRPPRRRAGDLLPVGRDHRGRFPAGRFRPAPAADLRRVLAGRRVRRRRAELVAGRARRAAQRDQRPRAGPALRPALGHRRPGLPADHAAAAAGTRPAAPGRRRLPVHHRPAVRAGRRAPGTLAAVGRAADAGRVRAADRLRPALHLDDRRRGHRRGAGLGRAGGAARARAGRAGVKQAFTGFDPAFEHRARLAIAVLLARHGEVSFAGFKQQLDLTDGNLGAQLRRLEDEGYVELRRDFVERKPVTWYRLTAQGNDALKRHLAALQQLIGAG